MVSIFSLHCIGKHPSLEAAKEEASTSGHILPLPTRDVHRLHVFMEFTCGNRKLGMQIISEFSDNLWLLPFTCLTLAFGLAGRIVVEVFEDQVQIAAQQFINRCKHGDLTFQGTVMHKLLPDLAIYGGRSTRYFPYFSYDFLSVFNRTTFPLCF